MPRGIKRGPSEDISRNTQLKQRVYSAVGVAVMTNPGDWLRGLREELHLTRVAVERFTSEAASRANNKRYQIRRGRLTQIEEGKAVPDIFEVESLCECYKVTYEAKS